MSALFSKMLTTRIAALLRAIRIVGEGEYGHRLQPVGRDELAQLAEEFNSLTDRLQTTEEVRRRFVSDASHELKTPLTSIIGYADMLRSRQMDGTARFKAASYIFSEGKRLENLSLSLMNLLVVNHSAADVKPVHMPLLCQRAGRISQPACAGGQGTVPGGNGGGGCPDRGLRPAADPDAESAGQRPQICRSFRSGNCDSTEHGPASYLYHEPVDGCSRH